MIMIFAKCIIMMLPPGTGIQDPSAWHTCPLLHVPLTIPLPGLPFTVHPKKENINSGASNYGPHFPINVRCAFKVDHITLYSLCLHLKWLLFSSLLSKHTVIYNLLCNTGQI